ncbi:MAG: apolipoprotein N-acyltransferase, partial [Caldimonas sp.]
MNVEDRLGRRSVELAFVATLGALQTLAYAEPAYWPVQWMAVALLAWRVGHAAPVRAALLGWAFGTAWLCAATWWLFVSLHRYGGLPAWLAVLAVFALSAFLSLYLAAAMAVVARWRSPSRWRGALLFAAAWLLAELARGVVFTGFPWAASGYAHVDSPLRGFAPWLGVYGIGGLAAGLAAAVAFPAAGGRGLSRPAILTFVGVLVAGALLGQLDFTRPTGTLAVTLLQGNVPQDEKFSARFVPEALAGTAGQLEQALGELVVGPETVIPLLPGQIDPAFRQALVDRFGRPGRAALLGMPMGDDVAGYTNSAIGLSSETAAMPGGAYRYDKHHLVPFGEFVPFGF